MDFIVNILSYVGWVLLAIMILVFVHELGHFLFAKLFNMRVDKFSVGFPPKILGKQIGQTEYVLGLTPLGGYVKIAGMVDESMDTEELSEEPQPWEFRSKPVWQRMLVITGGVLFNFILAAIIFMSLKMAMGEEYTGAAGAVLVQEGSIAHDMGLRSGDRVASVNEEEIAPEDGFVGLQDLLLADPLVIEVVRDGERMRFTGPSDIMTRFSRDNAVFGLGFNPNIVGSVNEDSPAEAAGLLPGDEIVAMGDSTIGFWRDLVAAVQANGKEAMTIRFVRPDSLTAIVPPTAQALADSLQPDRGRIYEVEITPAEINGQTAIGIGAYVFIRDYSFAEAIPAGFADMWNSTRLIVGSLKRVFTGQDNFRENIGGPVAIAKITKEAADQGQAFFWNIVAMLSITLAVINILPIPALDGGHLVFLIYEGIVRREPSLKVRMILQQVGMVLLLLFMVFVIFNDILKL